MDPRIQFRDSMGESLAAGGRGWRNQGASAGRREGAERWAVKLCWVFFSVYTESHTAQGCLELII